MYIRNFCFFTSILPEVSAPRARRIELIVASALDLVHHHMILCKVPLKVTYRLDLRGLLETEENEEFEGLSRFHIEDGAGS
jgi:hypothetical protein